MKLKYINSVVAIIISTFLVSCASTQQAIVPSDSYKPVEGSYIQKVDNFLVILDSSGTMDHGFKGTKKIDIAERFVARMNQTIPDIKVKGALRTIGNSGWPFSNRTDLLYGLTDYTKAGLSGALENLWASGLSPIALAINKTPEDLKPVDGNIAMILVSDGMETDSQSLEAANNLKKQFGDRICIYTVLIGDSPLGEKLLEQIAGIGRCGFAVSEKSVASPGDMANYVKKVFLKEALDSDGDGVLDAEDQCPDTPRGVQVNAQGCPLDTDGDGVYDYQDQCPGTLRGVAVDSKGCPLDSDGDGVIDADDQCPGTRFGVQVDSKGCPLEKDSDGDGVLDSDDQCPGTRFGVRVDSKGCPLDSDGDGVLDADDQCPNTPKGARVNEQGCWELPNVQFDTNKYDIKGQYFADIDEVVSILERNSSLNIEIQGHTDSRGSDSLNRTLSENRAKAIVEYLVNRGIQADRLSYKGFGPSKPVALNETEEGRAKNRRSELHPIN